MRFLIVFFAIFLFADVNTQLSKKSKEIFRTNVILDNLAKEIIKQEELLKEIEKQEENVQIKLRSLSSKLANSNETLSNLLSKKREIIKQEEKLKESIYKFISQNYYLDTKDTDSVDDIINSEIEKAILKKSVAKINSLIKEANSMKELLDEINKKISNIKNRQAYFNEIKQELQKLKQKRVKQLKKLKRQKEIYKNRLYMMIKKQKSLRKRLQQLKIVKKDIKVKMVGSSYMKSKIANYNGKKTIPPVKGKVIKKFGFYIDPIYKIKVYNDSITIKTKNNALVRSIFRGEVVFVLNKNDKKIVVVKHKNKMFSIYSNLSKISPLIYKGKILKKGEVIGRVKDKLEFEITYKDRPINPLNIVNLW